MQPGTGRLRLCCGDVMGDAPLLLGKAGLALFTGGLVLGALIPKFRNPRMGLSTHLTAVQAGTFLLAIGVFWPRFGVPNGLDGALAWALIGSSFVLTIGLAAAAATGASRALPIAGQGFRAGKTQEGLVTLLVLASSVVMLLACCCVLFFAFAA